MTTIRQIIIDAYREGGLVQAGLTPEADEFDEGLRKLQTIILSLYGNELGVPLTSVSYGNFGVTNAYGKEEDYSSTINSTYIPNNVRLMVNTDGVQTLFLPPNPQDGARVAIVDNTGNFATYNMTINGNGRKVEGAGTVVLNTDSVKRQWFYRGDLGEWVLVDELTANSQSPFPQEFDDYLITRLAMRMNPRYQAQSAPETLAAMRQAKNQFTSRYSQRTEIGVEDALLRLGRYGARFFDDLPSAARFDTGLVG